MSTGMKIEMKYIAVRDLFDGYDDNDNDEGGVVGYGGRLDIRPPYQREFVYKDKQRNAVIETVMKGFPLNVMYWAVNPGAGGDGSDTYEVIDGQQRTISICQYINGDFSVIGADGNPRYYDNLSEDEKNRILDYELSVYHCTGSDDEKLAWFKTINIAGEQLGDQELRNAVYTGRWLADAKKYFSKTSCTAYMIGSNYVKGVPNRQEYLEAAIRWISGGDIEGYMAKHQHDPTAQPLKAHFQAVIDWVKATFPNYRKEMKGIDWGPLYEAHHGEVLDPDVLEARVKELMADEDVTSKKGIYPYVLNGQERHLNIRKFNEKQKREAYERQSGVCPTCTGTFPIEEMEGDHITPWHSGGKSTSENCQMLCKDCNRKKSGV